MKLTQHDIDDSTNAVMQSLTGHDLAEAIGDSADGLVSLINSGMPVTAGHELGRLLRDYARRVAMRSMGIEL